MPAIRRRVDTSVDQSVQHTETGQKAEPAQGDAALTVAVGMASGVNINLTTFLGILHIFC